MADEFFKKIGKWEFHLIANKNTEKYEVEVKHKGKVIKIETIEAILTTELDEMRHVHDIKYCLKEFNAKKKELNAQPKKKRKITLGKESKEKVNVETNTTTRQQGGPKGLETEGNGEPTGLPQFPGTSDLFAVQRRGSKGLRESSKRNARRTALLPSSIELEVFDRVYAKLDPLSSHKQRLINAYHNDFIHWLWILQCNFNLLLFGCGSKDALLEAFADTHLSGEDCIAISGSTESGMQQHTRIKCLLDTIGGSIIHGPLASAQDFDTLDSYAKYIAGCLNVHYGREKSFVLALGHDKVKGKDRDSDMSSSRGLHQADMGQPHEGDMVEPSEDDSSIAASIAASIESSTDPHTGAGAVSKRRFFTEIATIGGGSGVGQVGVGVAQRELRQKAGQRLAAAPREVEAEWGKRYVHAQARLYIIVHAIDGDGLSDPAVQSALSVLAACESVSLVASVEGLASQLLWDAHMLAAFGWNYVHVPTYVSHTVQGDWVHGAKGAMKSNTHALDYILRSLTPRHCELLRILSDMRHEALAAAAASSSSAKGGPPPGGGRGEDTFPVEAVLERCVVKLVVNSLQQLHRLVQELVDHRLVAETLSESKKQCLCLLLPLEVESYLKTS